MKMKLDSELAQQAMALVALAFCSGPFDDLHAASLVRNVAARWEVSHISNAEMKRVMKAPVDTLYRLLWLREHGPEDYAEQPEFGQRYTLRWDDPEIGRSARSATRTE